MGFVWDGQSAWTGHISDSNDESQRRQDAPESDGDCPHLRYDPGADSGNCGSHSGTYSPSTTAIFSSARSLIAKIVVREILPVQSSSSGWAQSDLKTQNI